MSWCRAALHVAEADGASLHIGGVSEAMIDDGAVTSSKLAANAVTNSKVADGAVTLSKLASDVTDAINDFPTVGNGLQLESDTLSAKIGAGLQFDANNAIELANGDIDGAVSDWLDAHPEATTTVQDGSVTNAKLAQSGGVLSEVEDIRTGYDGTVYASAGAAVRAQTENLAGDITQLNKIDVDSILHDKLGLFLNNWTNIYIANDGAESANVKSVSSDYANVGEWPRTVTFEFDISDCSSNTQVYLAQYSSNSVAGFISRTTLATQVTQTTKTVTLDNNCKFIRLFAIDWDSATITLANCRERFSVYVSHYVRDTGGSSFNEFGSSFVTYERFAIYDGVISSTNGNEGTSSNPYKRSGFIAVNVGDVFSYNLYGYGTGTAKIAFYNSDKTYVRELSIFTSTTQATGDYTVQQNGFVRICSLIANDVRNPYFYLSSAAPETAMLVKSYIAENIDNAIVGTDILTMNRGIKSKLIQAIRRYEDGVYNSYQSNPPIFSILHFSDIHGAQAQLERIVEFKNEYADYLTDAICTGDMVFTKFSSGMDYWDAVSGSSSILTCIGNHDSTENNADDGYMTMEHTQAEMYAQYIEPYLSDWGNGVVCGDDLTYYYKDYDSNGIRLIVLDCMLTGAEKAAQVTWLETTLADAKTNDYSVICAIHYPSGTKLDCTFSPYRGLVSSYASTVAAYTDAVQDYIDSDGKFVCWLSGHTHRDQITTDTNHPNQLFVCVTTAQVQSSYSESDRVVGDKSQDAFNIVAIDTISKTLKIVRVGENLDCFMRGKNMLTIDYLNNTVIAND